MSALDNVEVWQEDAVTCQGCHTTFPYYTSEEPTCPNCGKKPVWVLGENGTGRWEYWFLVAGRAWWYWHCFSGCFPESEARGPYDTEQEALDAAHEDLGVCTHGIPDDYICDDCPTPELWALQDETGRYLVYGMVLGVSNKLKVSCFSSEATATLQACRLESANLTGLKVVKLSDHDARRWGKE